MQNISSYLCTQTGRNKTNTITPAIKARLDKSHGLPTEHTGSETNYLGEEALFLICSKGNVTVPLHLAQYLFQHRLLAV